MFHFNAILNLNWNIKSVISFLATIYPSAFTYQQAHQAGSFYINELIHAHVCSSAQPSPV